MILDDKHSLLFCESVQDQLGLVQIKLFLRGDPW